VERQENPDNEILRSDWMKTLIIVLLLITAAINAVGGSVLWVAQGNYVSECANDKNKGLFNSVLWTFNMATFASGNIIAATVITALSTSTFYIIMTGFTIAACIYFIFLKKPRP
jgi:hypothetical protein